MSIAGVLPGRIAGVLPFFLGGGLRCGLKVEYCGASKGSLALEWGERWARRDIMNDGFKAMSRSESVAETWKCREIRASAIRVAC